MAPGNGGALQVYNEVTPMSVADLQKQVNLIQEVMRSVMKEGEHFGKIPGCGDKPTLLKAGAEKISMVFRLVPTIEEEIIDLAGGHREYRCKVKMYTQSGVLIGEGVATCSTMESKYRFRVGPSELTGREVPGDYWNLRGTDPVKAQALLGGKGFSPRKNPDTGKWEIAIQGEKVEHDNPADYYNCVTPDTKVLTRDLQWIPAGDIESGEMLIGVEENMTDQYARHMAIGEATVHGRKIDNLYELTLEDGRTVRCNGEHKWLVKKVGLKGTEWVTTEAIHKEVHERKGRPRNWFVMSVCTPWVEDTSKEAGYIAGLLDADGSLGSTQLGVLFAQQQNTVLTLLQRGLLVRGYQLGFDSVKSNDAVEQSNSKQQVFQVRVRGGFAEQLRLLGSIRPPRLLERWLTYWDLSTRRLEGRGSGAGRPVKIASVESIGEGEVVLLGTSCKTYLAEGLVCHNTCEKMAKKRAMVDAVLTVTAASDIFTQDIEDLADNGVVGNGAKQQAAEKKADTVKSKGNGSAPATPPPATGDNVTGIVENVEVKNGGSKEKPWTKYAILVGGKKYSTFDKKIGEEARALKGKKATLTVKQDGNFWNCLGIAPAEDKPTEAHPTGEGIPSDCTHQPLSCDYSSYVEDNVLCTAMDKQPCKFPPPPMEGEGGPV